MYSQIASNKRRTWVIMFGFLALVGAIAYLFSKLYGTPTITIMVLIGAVIYTLIQYFAADKLAVAINGARQIEKGDDPRLWRIVENLAITEGLPMPRVYIMQDPGLNAFATGRDPDHSLVCVTTGLLGVMDDSELQGVIAHELSHIKNYDIRVSLIAFGLVSFVALLCDFFLRISFWGGGFRSRDNDSNSNNSVLMALAVVAVILAPIVASLLQLAISRKREYLADASGVLATRYPEGLASALAKIRDTSSVLKRQNTATAHLFFANPLKGQTLSALFSTHPPLDQRIERLRQMGTQL